KVILVRGLCCNFSLSIPNQILVPLVEALFCPVPRAKPGVRKKVTHSGDDFLIILGTLTATITAPPESVERLFNEVDFFTTKPRKVTTALPNAGWFCRRHTVYIRHLRAVNHNGLRILSRSEFDFSAHSR